MNKTRCVDCFRFKTRVIPSYKKLTKDEFWDSKALCKRLKAKNAKGQRIYYCINERRPLMESRSVHRRIKPECKWVDPI